MTWDIGYTGSDVFNRGVQYFRQPCASCPRCGEAHHLSRFFNLMVNGEIVNACINCGLPWGCDDNKKSAGLGTPEQVG